MPGRSVPCGRRAQPVPPRPREPPAQCRAPPRAAAPSRRPYHGSKPGGTRAPRRAHPAARRPLSLLLRRGPHRSTLTELCRARPLHRGSTAAAPLGSHRPLPPAPLPKRWKSPERAGRGRGWARGAAPGAGPREGAAGPLWQGCAALGVPVLGALGAGHPGPTARPRSCRAAARTGTARSLPTPGSPQPKFAPPSAERSRGSSPELQPGRSAPGALGNSAMLRAAALFCVRLLLALTGKKTVLLGK